MALGYIVEHIRVRIESRVDETDHGLSGGKALFINAVDLTFG